MASSKKTSSLGLNLWEETDKPERSDFVSDNQKLEELVGAHLKSTALHLTTDEKAWVKSPIYTFSFQGDGSSTKVYTLSFEPRIILVFAVSRANGIVENDLHSVFQAMQISAYKTPGISRDGAKITLTQQNVADAISAGTGYRLRMNEKGVNYCGLAIR